MTITPKSVEEIMEEFDLEILAKTYIDAGLGLSILVDEKRAWFRSALASHLLWAAEETRNGLQAHSPNATFYAALKALAEKI